MSAPCRGEGVVKRFGASCRRVAMGVLAGLAPWALGACATGGQAGAESGAAFVFVRLVTGPGGAGLTDEQRKEVFRGHMSNMQRLADEQKLVIAGPYAKPRDATWRGVFVMNVAEPEEAAALAATDPGVIAGVFATQIHPMRASARLRDALRLEEEMQAEAEAAKARGETLRTLRPYVMVTAEDAASMREALAGAGLWSALVWSGEFTDATARAGVFVLDSEDPEGVAAELKGLRTGGFSVDGWYSSAALERLKEAGAPPRERRRTRR